VIARLMGGYTTLEKCKAMIATAIREK